MSHVTNFLLSVQHKTVDDANFVKIRLQNMGRKRKTKLARVVVLTT